jgi:glycosyltransferase involved in cell wall biosynthesis
MKRETEESTNRLSLIVQYYRCATNERQTEIDTCLRNNLVNPYLTAIHLLTEELFDVSSFPNNEKIVQTVIGERLTFERAFTYANEVDPAGDVVWVLCNADIYFDETLRLVKRNNLDGTVYALTRHDVQPDGTTKLVDETFAHGSQDVWMFTTPIDLERMYTKFRLGVPGCDNRIAYEFIRSNYVVVNPSLAVMSQHLDLTRESSISARTNEYVKMHTEDNIRCGVVAPPPYQFYLYPTTNLEIAGFDVFRKMQLGLFELTNANEQLVRCSRHIQEQEDLLNLGKQQVLEREQAILEREQTILSLVRRNEDIVRSMSWRVTAPIRYLFDKIMRASSPDRLSASPSDTTFNPKVSIIIPVYNGSNYLRLAIESAINQTYTNTEIIVIDDGSRDDGKTEEVARSFGDRIRYVRKENGGVGSALNTGLSIMTGDYFSWLSHDDIYYPNKLEVQIEFIRQTGKKNAILFSDWEHIDGSGASLGCRVIEKDEITNNLYVVMNCVINGCTLLVPTDCFRDVGGFDESLPTTQDYDLWFRLARKYEFIHVPRILVKYRIHPQQDSFRHAGHVEEQNNLHASFNMVLTDEEIRAVEDSLPTFFIKRALFYRNKFPKAEQYAYERFRETMFMCHPVCFIKNAFLLVKYHRMKRRGNV